jgi:hypothetical protein
LLLPGDIICLSGDMGAGKTVFSGGIGKGWGAKTPLTSPTFNLVHDHTREADSQHLYHLDCYRLERPNDADTIGIDEMGEGKTGAQLGGVLAGLGAHLGAHRLDSGAASDYTIPNQGQLHYSRCATQKRRLHR